VPEDLFDEPERRAAEKLAAARRFLARGKLRDALDALNLAIQLAPGNPGAFRDRASVFERMGLGPQAEADRLRAAELTAAQPPQSEEEEAGETPEMPPAPPRGRSKARPGEGGSPPRVPPPPEPEYVHEPVATDIPREEGRGPGIGAAVLTIAVALLFAAGIAGGIAFVVLSLGGDDEPSPSATPFGTTGVATGGGTATPTVEPTTPGTVSTSGDPYSLSALVSAWKGKGMEVETGGASQGFRGFKTAPSEVTMMRGGATSTAAVFVYKTREAALDEWDLVPGSRPQPKGSRTVPTHVSAWWNANVVVVLRTDPGALGTDALDGLLNLGG